MTNSTMHIISTSNDGNMLHDHIADFFFLKKVIVAFT